MISQTAEYALRAMCYLATQDSARTTQEIADVTRVPVGYLSKVLQLLARRGLVNSQRGIRGGFTIAKPATDLSIWEIINAVDPLQRIRSCPLGLVSHGVNLCPLHKRLDDAMASVEKAFRDSNLAELLAEPSTSIPLCDIKVEFARPCHPLPTPKPESNGEPAIENP